jgi:transposase-like protein
MTSQYTQEFKEQALAKTLQRGDQTIQCIADELNVNIFTLKGWLRDSKTTMTTPNTDKRPSDWTQAQRFQALMGSAPLEGEALNAFCRTQGIFSHHLEHWKAEFIQASDSVSPSVKSKTKALREENKQLKKELNRKEKALAETAALRVLQKKCQAFWEEKA